MERHINVKGGYNIRDIGGYKTSDGGIVKWRKLFRAGLLSRIDMSQPELMSSLSLRSICDFRTLAEQEASPDSWHELEKLKRYSFPIGEGRVDKLEQMKATDLMAGDSHHLYKANRSYVTKEAQQYRDYFKMVLDADNYPILYHCTAGKDRTGFATFLLLSALGVDRQTIIEDYLLTNVYLKSFVDNVVGGMAKNLGIAEHLVRTIFEAKSEYLSGALKPIEERHGSVEIYLEEELHVGASQISKLKELLVDYK